MLDISILTTDVACTERICLVLYFCTILLVSATWTLMYSSGKPATTRIMTISSCMGNQFWKGLPNVNTRTENEVWTTYWKAKKKKKKQGNKTKTNQTNKTKNFVTMEVNIGLFHFHSKRLSSRRQIQLERIIEEKSSQTASFLLLKSVVSQPAFLLTGIIILWSPDLMIPCQQFQTYKWQKKCIIWKRLIFANYNRSPALVNLPSNAYTENGNLGAIVTMYYYLSVSS